MMNKIKYFIRLFLIVIVTIYYSTISLVLMLFKGGNVYYELSRIWSKIILKICNVNIEIISEDGFFPDKNESYVYVTNHSSMFDIPVLLSTLPNNTRILYKKELEKVPIWGYCLKKSPFVSIVREDAKNALNTLKETISSIQKEGSLIVFPEGTRSTDGQVHEFKRGAFMLAAKSEKDVVPITIIGTDKLLQKNEFVFRSGRVKLIISNKLSSKDFKNDREMMESVRRIIITNFEKYQ